MFMHEYVIKISCSLYIIFWVDLQSASTTAKPVIQTQMILLVGKINSYTLLQALKFNHMKHLLLEIFEMVLSLISRSYMR